MNSVQNSLCHNKMVFTRRNIILFSFRLILIALFFYQAFHLLDSFLNQEPVTKTIKKTQEGSKMPMVCISKRINDTSYNVSKVAFRNGQWKIGNFTEEEFYEKVSVELGDLIEDEISIQKFVDKYGQYETIKLKYKSKPELLKHGVKMFKLHYYFYLKNFCFEFSTAQFPYGVYSIRIKQISNLDMWALPPGRHTLKDCHQNY